VEVELGVADVVIKAVVPAVAHAEAEPVEPISEDEVRMTILRLYTLHT